MTVISFKISILSSPTQIDSTKFVSFWPYICKPGYIFLEGITMLGDIPDTDLTVNPPNQHVWHCVHDQLCNMQRGGNAAFSCLRGGAESTLWGSLGDEGNDLEFSTAEQLRAGRGAESWDARGHIYLLTFSFGCDKRDFLCLFAQVLKRRN